MKLKVDGYFAGDNMARPIREAIVLLTQSIDDLTWSAEYRGVTSSFWHNERRACEAVLSAYHETQVNVTTIRTATPVIVASVPKKPVEPGMKPVEPAALPVVTVTTKLAERHVGTSALQGRARRIPASRKPVTSRFAKPAVDLGQHIELCFGETRAQMDEMFRDIRKHAGKGRLTLACNDGIERRIVTCGTPIHYPLVDKHGCTQNRWMAHLTQVRCGIECEWALWVTCANL